MNINYSISSTNSTLQTCNNKKLIVYIENACKTATFSLFVGTTLLAAPFSNLSNDVKYINNYSPAIHIDCANINVNKEINYLNNSQFLDLLKIDNLKKLDCMAAFQEDWNGSGGQVFSAASINLFKDILENVCSQPSIAPTGRSSLLLQYELRDYSMLAFEVSENCVDMVCVPQGDYSSATNKKFTNNFIEQINFEVAQFYGFKQN